MHAIGVADDVGRQGSARYSLIDAQMAETGKVHAATFIKVNLIPWREKSVHFFAIFSSTTAEPSAIQIDLAG
jgi:hypothetical protein